MRITNFIYFFHYLLLWLMPTHYPGASGDLWAATDAHLPQLEQLVIEGKISPANIVARVTYWEDCHLGLGHVLLSLYQYSDRTPHGHPLNHLNYAMGNNQECLERGLKKKKVTLIHNVDFNLNHNSGTSDLLNYLHWRQTEDLSDAKANYGKLYDFFHMNCADRVFEALVQLGLVRPEQINEIRVLSAFSTPFGVFQLAQKLKREQIERDRNLAKVHQIQKAKANVMRELTVKFMNRTFLHLENGMMVMKWTDHTCPDGAKEHEMTFL